MKELLNYLEENRKTISVSESFTGGMFSNALTNLDNSSRFFKGGFICYTNKFKEDILKINTIKKYGVVSKETALQLAKKTLKKLKTDIVISFTGNAPINNEVSSLGLSYICIYKNGYFDTYEFISKTKNRIKYKTEAIDFAISKIIN